MRCCNWYRPLYVDSKLIYNYNAVAQPVHIVCDQCNQNLHLKSKNLHQSAAAFSVHLQSRKYPTHATAHADSATGITTVAFATFTNGISSLYTPTGYNRCDFLLWASITKGNSSVLLEQLFSCNNVLALDGSNSDKSICHPQKQHSIQVWYKKIHHSFICSRIKLLETIGTGLLQARCPSFTQATTQQHWREHNQEKHLQTWHALFFLIHRSTKWFLKEKTSNFIYATSQMSVASLQCQ